MSKKPSRKKHLQRAAPAYAPGGALMYVPPQMAQSVLSQTFYGGKAANVATGQTPVFSPGEPLPPQPGLDPLGKPVQFRFPVSYNVFPVDRSLGMPDIPSFEQLRRFAKMCDGIGLAERFWLDMVPRMTLNIKIKKEYADQGAEEKNYQKEIKFFKNFFDKPDGKADLHTWIRKALRDQTQIDELYIYKHKTRGNKLLGLWIVDGAQMKPLLDVWGMQPDPPGFAFQQFPWGIPGIQYRSDQIIHYQESPASDTPYGFARTERVIGRINEILRKLKVDLNHFTEGNIPQSFMEVPESLNWTPDQIDSYEQSWNALLAGNAQQQVRMKFMAPGMKYTPAEQYQVLTDFDLFLFKVIFGVYGVPPAEFGFTEDVNRSSGESQEDIVYRRTIEPLAIVYAMFFTMVMNDDFPPDMHGEMFEASFGGYEEIEDEEAKATALTKYTGAGILGLSAAAKLANLPSDPDAPPIGRMIMTASGPIFLDDVAQPDMRKAQADATMAGYKMAANPPQPPKSGQPGAGNNQDQGQSNEDNASEKDVDEAMDEADKSLSTLSRSDPIHGYHGEFGYDGGPQSRPSKGGHHGGKHGKGGHHAKGPRMSAKDRMHARMQKLAARFDKLEDRKLGKHWSEAQSEAAGKLSSLFNQIASAIAKGGQQQLIDGLLDKAYAQAKIVFASKPRGLTALSRALTRIDKMNDRGLLRAVEVDEDEEEEDEDFEELEEELDLELAEDTGQEDDIHRTLSRISKTLDMLLRERQGENLEQRAQSDTEGQTRDTGDLERETVRDARAGAQSSDLSVGETRSDRQEISAEFRRWRARAIEDVKANRQQRGFTTTLIPGPVHGIITRGLARCQNTEHVRAVFERVRDVPESEISGEESLLEYNPILDLWEPADADLQLKAYQDRGVQFLRWDGGISNSGTCEICRPNIGQVRRVGETFSNGARLPRCHFYCQCGVTPVDENGKEIQ